MPPLRAARSGGSRDALYVGIDLGTMRTAVAASNGSRRADWSYVGYPKDLVSRKLLGRDRIHGQEALDNRMALELFRPFEHGVIKYGDQHGALSNTRLEDHLRAAKDLVRYAVEMAQPRRGQQVYGVIGAPAQASLENKRFLVDSTRGALDAVMVCSEPFAVAYGLGMLNDTLVVDIGAGTVDLCRMYGTMPAAEDQLTLSTAGDWLDEQILGRFCERVPEADITRHQIQAIKDRYGFVGETSSPVLVELAVRGRPTTFDMTRVLRDACRLIVQPIVDAIQELISSFDPDFQSVLRHNVLLSGGGSQIRDLGQVVEEALRSSYGSGRVRQCEEPVFAGCNGALQIARDMPRKYWQQLR